MHPLEGNMMLLQLAESMQADSLWAPDHILGVFHPELWSEMAYSSLAADPDAFYDPWILGGVLGQHTDIPFGLSVTDATRRRAPDVARSALTLQHLCRGGFNLGVGSGEAESLVTFGYDFSRPVARTEEFLHELRALLDTGRMPDPQPSGGGLSGRMGLPLESAAGTPKVWLAGHGPRMLRLTGQYADGWLPAWPMSPEEYGAKRSTIAGHAAGAGRPEPEYGLLIFMVLGRSKEHIAQLMDDDPLGKLFALFCPADRWLAHGYDHPFGNESKGFIDLVVHDLDPDELRELAPKLPLELVEEVVFMGSPEEIAERVAGYARHGCEHIVLGNMTGVVGGLPEIEASGPGLFQLRETLAAL
jgi:phthiodiolone/phenolphthiodiolone dimycocerosates ketoreductase